MARNTNPLLKLFFPNDYVCQLYSFIKRWYPISWKNLLSNVYYFTVTSVDTGHPVVCQLTE